VAVVAGGATAKLGMNAKEHVKKGVPLLEDVLGGFAVLISENDGVSPRYVWTALASILWVRVRRHSRSWAH